MSFIQIAIKYLCNTNMHVKRKETAAQWLFFCNIWSLALMPCKIFNQLFILTTCVFKRTIWIFVALLNEQKNGIIFRPLVCVEVGSGSGAVSAFISTLLGANIMYMYVKKNLIYVHLFKEYYLKDTQHWRFFLLLGQFTQIHELMMLWDTWIY